MVRFIEEFCRIPDGPHIGDAMTVHPFWRTVIYELFEMVPEEGGWRRHYSQALLGVPKKNLKTTISAAIGLYLLLGDDNPGAFVVCAAATEEQSANLLFGAAKMMCELSPELKQLTQVYSSEIAVPSLPRARMRNVTSKSGSNDGKNASVVICDELHEWKGEAGRDLYHVLEGATAAIPNGLMLSITTAGYDQGSVCYEKYDYGRRVSQGQVRDDRFYFRWLEPPEGADYRDPQVWTSVNPLLGTAIQEDFIRDRVARDPEYVVRRYHLNQWVAAEQAWLPPGAWDRCRGAVSFDAALPLCVGIDVGVKHDSSAVVMAQRQDDGITRVRARVWENPYREEDSRYDSWKLDIVAVENYLRELRSAYPASARSYPDSDAPAPGPAFFYDPHFFERSSQALAEPDEEGISLNMVEYPQSNMRMVPAAQAAYQLITEGKVVHDGDVVLARQIAGAISRETDRGWRLSKPHGSRVHIDAAIALVIALHEAQHEPPHGSVYNERGMIVLG